MCNINNIMDLLDWNNSLEGQAKGISLAKQVENIYVFLQPISKKHNKNVWDNCAKILSDKSDGDLRPYLVQLLKWLQDSNWPGFACILNRMNSYVDNQSFRIAFDQCMIQARDTSDDMWESNLLLIEKEG